MYLSDRDIRWAVETGDLILPEDAKIDPTSVDLPLDKISEAKVWDIEKFARENGAAGLGHPELRLGSFRYVDFAGRYLRDLPEDRNELVYRRGDEVIIKPHGFLLWQTRGDVGTPDTRADLICFVNGKSTRARTGLLVHFTAPTIHARWSGHIVLEITNLGPFHFVLSEGDVIAQLTVAKISSSPAMSHNQSTTLNQQDVGCKR
jgi:dCTP deaminase